jgi:hypothetical protein
MTPSPSVPSRLAASLACLAFAACSRATPAASGPAVEAAPGAAAIGSWSRDAQGCARPEFQLRSSEVVIQTDGDGTPVTFTYANVAWSSDAQGQVTVDLNKPHPYGKAASKTALTFKPVGTDEIDLVQRNKLVPLHRCPAR